MSAAGSGQGRLRVFSLGFLRQGWLRRALRGIGWQVTVLPWPKAGAVAVWGRRPVASRGLRAAARLGLPVLTLEDAFLRSPRPGSGRPLGLLADDLGVHYDPEAPSRLAAILDDPALFTPEVLARARAGMAELRRLGLSKYSPVPRGAGPLPDAGFVLILDQVRGDAAVAAGRAGPADFEAMIAAARRENPGLRLFLRRHPDRRRGGYVAGVEELPEALNIWDVLERAARVYAVSSQAGFEAILAGHRPRIFGAPFYAGRGLTEDARALPGRRSVSPAELFAGAMILAPDWFDGSGRPLAFEQALHLLEARVKAEHRRLQPVAALGFSRWKRRHMRRWLNVASWEDGGRDVAIWASRAAPEPARDGREIIRVEDGFLRSAGLGADLVPPLSLIFDRQGIYYDATRPSELEGLIAASADLPEAALARAAALRAAVVAAGVSKYNLGASGPPVLPQGRRIVLVAGQVEDDASIRLGCSGPVRTNAALLAEARRLNPEAFLVWKPHPDVEAGLRPGRIAAQEADLVLRGLSAPAALGAADEVWTMTSLLGFEALLRGRPVTTLGMPFYAGWGLTRDLGPPCPRRGGGVTLDGLVHAALIAYPAYADPATGEAMTAEEAVAWLARHRAGPRLVRPLQRLALRLGLLRRGATR